MFLTNPVSRDLGASLCPIRNHFSSELNSLRKLDWDSWHHKRWYQTARYLVPIQFSVDAWIFYWYLGHSQLDPETPLTISFATLDPRNLLVHHHHHVGLRRIGAQYLVLKRHSCFYALVPWIRTSREILLNAISEPDKAIGYLEYILAWIRAWVYLKSPSSKGGRSLG